VEPPTYPFQSIISIVGWHREWMLRGKSVVNIDSYTSQFREPSAEQSFGVQSSQTEPTAMIYDEYRTAIFRRLLWFVYSYCNRGSVADRNLPVFFDICFFSLTLSDGCHLPLPFNKQLSDLRDIAVPSETWNWAIVLDDLGQSVYLLSKQGSFLYLVELGIDLCQREEFLWSPHFANVTASPQDTAFTSPHSKTPDLPRKPFCTSPSPALGISFFQPSLRIASLAV
jgi:hypothetical protein